MLVASDLVFAEIFKEICLMKKTDSLLRLFLLVIICSVYAGCQERKVNCTAIKNGRFYFYPSRSDRSYMILRKDSLQTEIDVKTGGTSFWRVRWIDSCTYTTRFLYASSPEVTNLFSNNHIVIVQILRARKDYYVFTGRLDSISSPNSLTDTIWLHKK